MTRKVLSLAVLLNSSFLAAFQSDDFGAKLSSFEYRLKLLENIELVQKPNIKKDEVFLSLKRAKEYFLEKNYLSALKTLTDKDVLFQKFLSPYEEVEALTIICLSAFHLENSLVFTSHVNRFFLAYSKLDKKDNFKDTDIEMLENLNTLLQRQKISSATGKSLASDLIHLKIDDSKKPEYMLVISKIFHSLKEYDIERNLLNQIVDIHPSKATRARVYLQLSVVSLSQKKTKEAQSFFDKISPSELQGLDKDYLEIVGARLFAAQNLISLSKPIYDTYAKNPSHNIFKKVNDLDEEVCLFYFQNSFYEEANSSCKLVFDNRNAKKLTLSTLNAYFQSAARSHNFEKLKEDLEILSQETSRILLFQKDASLEIMTTKISEDSMRPLQKPLYLSFNSFLNLTPEALTLSDKAWDEATRLEKSAQDGVLDARKFISDLTSTPNENLNFLYTWKSNELAKLLEQETHAGLRYLKEVATKLADKSSEVDKRKLDVYFKYISQRLENKGKNFLKLEVYSPTLDKAFDALLEIDDLKQKLFSLKRFPQVPGATSKLNGKKQEILFSLVPKETDLRVIALNEELKYDHLARSYKLFRRNLGTLDSAYQVIWQSLSSATTPEERASHASLKMNWDRWIESVALVLKSVDQTMTAHQASLKKVGEEVLANTDHLLSLKRQLRKQKAELVRLLKANQLTVSENLRNSVSNYQHSINSAKRQMLWFQTAVGETETQRTIEKLKADASGEETKYLQKDED